MKKLALVFTFALGFSPAFAAKTPAAVLKAFARKFPHARQVIWIKEDIKVWEAVFNLDGAERFADFSDDGKWVETEVRIQIESLPAASLEIGRAHV